MVFIVSMLFWTLVSRTPSLSVRYGSIKVDGFEDDVWNKADSVLITKISEPYYGEKSTYKTVVKVLQDKHNLYILFRVDYGKRRPSTKLSGIKDHYTVFLDPLMTKVESYLFSVSTAGERFDGMVLGDGSDFDGAWDGVWDAKVRIFLKDGHYFASSEFKIPFKTLKFKKDVHTWGANFKCGFDEIGEDAWWILPPENEDVRVSMFGRLMGVNPQDEGLGLEVYPVLLLRHEYSEYAEVEGFKLKGGLDFKYKTGPYSLSITTFPDFAEIEADPFRMSLGRNEIYYTERRPFFLEGQEVFSASGVRYSPVEILYTRRIGKKYSDIATYVPILFGGKFIEKGERTELGVMSVLTGKLNTPTDTAFPLLFNAVRVKQKMLSNSEVGMAGVFLKGIERDSVFYAAEADGILRKKRNAFAWQFVTNKSDSGTLGLLFQAGGLFYFKKSYLAGFYTGVANSKFNVSPTGYTNFFPDDKIASLYLGYYKYGKKGSSFRRLSINLSLNGVKYANDPGLSKAISMNGLISFERPIKGGMHTYLSIGRDYTQDTAKILYTSKAGEIGLWGRIKDTRFHINYNQTYGWNYARGYRAKYSFVSLGIYMPLSSRISLDYDLNFWNEYMPSGSFLSSTLSGEGRLTYKFTPFMELSLSSNHVGLYEDSFTPLTNRISLYYSWEIKPKSKLYVVFNESLNRIENTWKSTEHIYAFKIRYLFLI